MCVTKTNPHTLDELKEASLVHQLNKDLLKHVQYCVHILWTYYVDARILLSILKNKIPLFDSCYYENKNVIWPNSMCNIRFKNNRVSEPHRI